MFDITGKTLKPVSEARSSDEMDRWWNTLAEEGRAMKASESLQRSMTSTEIEALARQVFEEVSRRAVDAGVTLPQEYILRLIGDLSGMGPLLELIARSDIEDIAINLGHIYVYTTTNG
jgi:Flp pilus assembly CpaF family ATPase